MSTVNPSQGTILSTMTTNNHPMTNKTQQLEEDSVDIIFHGIPYNLSVTVIENNQPEPTLCIDLENLTNTTENWHGEFSSSYIENITSKTGSFKRFNVLVKMLMGALRQQTEAVFLDLLTYSDLEALRSKKNGTNPKPSTTGGGKSPNQGPGMNKRYLILTYVVEFDRVHYPLPLTFEEAPTVPIYQRLTRRLRRELLTYKSLAGLSESSVGLTANGLPSSASNALSTSVAGLQRENTVLRQMLVEQENKERIAQETIRTLETKIIGLQDTVNAGDTALEKLRLASRAEVKRLRQEIQEYQTKLGITPNINHNEYTNDNSTNNTDKDTIYQLQNTNEQLKLRIQDLTKQLALSTNGSSSSSSSKHTNNTTTNRGRTTNRTPTHQVGPQNSTSSVSRRSTSNTSRGLSPSNGSIISNRSSTINNNNTQNRLSQASSIYGNTRNPTPTRRTTNTHGTVTPTNSTRNRTPTNQSSNRTPTSVYGTPNSIGSNNGPRSGARGTSNSRTPKSTGGTPSTTNGTTRSNGTNNRTTARPSQRSITPSGRSVSSQQSTQQPSPSAHQKSQISHSSKTRTPTGNRTNIASPYLTGVEPILATMERNYKQRNENNHQHYKSLTPNGTRTTNSNAQKQQQQPHAIYGNGTTSKSNSRGPSPARVTTTTTSKGNANGTMSVVVPVPPPAPMMVRSSNTTTNNLPTTEPPVIPRTAWTDTNENMVSNVSMVPTVVTLPSSSSSSSSSSSVGGSGSGTVSPGGTKYSYDSSAEMHDIDTRLQQLQDFLKAAKSGGPLPNVQL